MFNDFRPSGLCDSGSATGEKNLSIRDLQYLGVQVAIQRAKNWENVTRSFKDYENFLDDIWIMESIYQESLIWYERFLCEQGLCSGTNWPNRSFVGKEVLEHGQINFDSTKWYAGRKTRPRDLVRLYCLVYLPMHFSSSLCQMVLSKDLLTQRILDSRCRIQFVDLGCGPFTCGFALMSFLKQIDQSIDVDYVGIDVSRTMREQSLMFVNERVKPNLSNVELNATWFDSWENYSKQFSPDMDSDTLTIFNFCYVLSSPSLKQSVRNIADHLTSLSRTSSIIMHQNPKNRHSCWSEVRSMLRGFSHDRQCPTEFSFQFRDHCNTWNDAYSIEKQVACATLATDY